MVGQPLLDQVLGWWQQRGMEQTMTTTTADYTATVPWPTVEVPKDRWVTHVPVHPAPKPVDKVTEEELGLWIAGLEVETDEYLSRLPARMATVPLYPSLRRGCSHGWIDPELDVGMSSNKKNCPVCQGQGWTYVPLNLGGMPELLAALRAHAKALGCPGSETSVLGQPEPRTGDSDG